MKATRAKPVDRPSEMQLFLRIKHPSMDPATISQALGIEPEQAIAAGTDVSSTGVRRLHSESYWIAKLPMASIIELTGSFQAGISLEPALVSKEGLAALRGATGQDVRLLALLERFEAHEEFFDRINADGGSITLIVDRGEENQPVVLKRALRKLAGLGIALEVD